LPCKRQVVSYRTTASISLGTAKTNVIHTFNAKRIQTETAGQELLVSQIVILSAISSIAIKRKNVNLLAHQALAAPTSKRVLLTNGRTTHLQSLYKSSETFLAKKTMMRFSVVSMLFKK
jgi:hypothetical protein